MAAKMKGLALGPDADISQILSTLEQGTTMMRFYRRKGSRPEKHLYCLKADTLEILQFVMAAGRSSMSPRNADESSKCRKKNPSARYCLVNIVFSDCCSRCAKTYTVVVSTIEKHVYRIGLLSLYSLVVRAF